VKESQGGTIKIIEILQKPGQVEAMRNLSIEVVIKKIAPDVAGLLDYDTLAEEAAPVFAEIEVKLLLEYLHTSRPERIRDRTEQLIGNRASPVGRRCAVRIS
jgi:hypothetical protein